MDLFDYAKHEDAGSNKASTDKQIYTVTQVTREIKHVLTQHFLPASPVVIEGEISNFRGKNSSGHMYFQLKDEGAVLPCVFFRFANQKCTFNPKEGALVEVQGKVEVYEKGGRYQLVIERMKEKGKGDMYEKFLQLKGKLEDQGLFDPEHKKELSAYPKRIGVLTSPTGSVIRDIIHVVKHRAPNVDVVLFPSVVQGDQAVPTLKDQLARAQHKKFSIDVIIIGRGGGSIEDLWAFNDESLAKDVFACAIPVISAVGHQTDFTICDFVADQRAATPSQAAELAVADMGSVHAQMKKSLGQMYQKAQSSIELKKQQLTRWMSSPMMRDPRAHLHQKIQFVDDLNARLKEMIKHVLPLRMQAAQVLEKELQSNQLRILKQNRDHLHRLTSSLELLDPTSVLARGYSIVKDRNKKIISHVDQVHVEDKVDVVVSDGVFQCSVLKK